MEKFGRQYQLNVGLQDGSTLTVELPFTVQFDITRNVLTSANLASIRIYNLSSINRNKIRKNLNDFGDLRLIELRAGYGSNLPVIFNGCISQAWSVRESVNFITQIESFDGGFAFANSFSTQNFAKGTPNSTIVKTLMGNLSAQNVQFGGIGDSVQGSSGRGAAYSGPTVDLLRELSGGSAFIDNGKVYVLGKNECLPAKGISVINSASGLLGTPVLEQSILHFDMLFEPRLTVGQIVALDSITAPVFNSNYKVVSLQHHGMISEAVCGEAITSVGLFAPLAGSSLSVISGAA